MGRSPLAIIVVAAFSLLGGCTPGAVEPLPPPPSVVATTTTTVIDFGAIGLPGVPGRTTTSIGVGPGKATMNGGVNGPDGPVEGAVVHVERLVGDGMATMDLLTGPDGKYSIPKILGGRYRVRAWKAAPDNLALVEPEVFFLEGSETKTVNLGITRYQGVSVTAAIAPDPPLISSPSNLVVQIVNREVDPAGIVRSTPVPAVSAELFGSGDWRVQSANPTAADNAGRARWQLECRRVGAQPLSVVVGDTATFNLNLPACTVPPPTGDELESDPDTPPTTTAGAPATSTTGQTTSTTRPTASTATTSTTARPATTTTSR